MTKKNPDTIAPIFRAFHANTPLKQPEINRYDEGEFTDSFEISYASPRPDAEWELRKHFSGLNVKIEAVPGRDAYKVIISKVEKPRYFDYISVLKYAEKNRDKGILLGIADHGPVFWDINRHLTHAAVDGQSGMGKTSLGHSMLMQSILQGNVNHIIDPKANEFARYRGIPGVGLVAVSSLEINTLLRLLAIELQARKSLFQFFKCAPTNLEEYNILRVEYRTDLPELHRTIVFIDEFRGAIGDDYYDNWSFIELLVRQGRSFGMNVFMMSQRLGDLRMNILQNVDCIFNFYGTGIDFAPLDEGKVPARSLKPEPIQGRMTVKIQRGEADTEFLCQTPYVSANDAFMILAALNKRNQLPNHGFIRLKFKSSGVIQSGTFMRDLLTSVDLVTLCNRHSGKFDPLIGSRTIDFKYFSQVHTFQNIEQDVSKVISGEKYTQQSNASIAPIENRQVIPDPSQQGSKSAGPGFRRFRFMKRCTKILRAIIHVRKA